MKKLLSIVAVAALFSTGAMADDTITITGEILPSAVVGFVDVSGEALTGTDKFIDATIDLGTYAVNEFNAGALEASSRDIFVKTNVASGNLVTMSIDSANADKNTLLDTVSSETIPVIYKIGTTEVTPDGSTLVTVAEEANAGSSAINDKFTIVTDAADDQLAGTYGAILTVAIVAN